MTVLVIIFVTAMGTKNGDGRSFGKDLTEFKPVNMSKLFTIIETKGRQKGLE